MTAIRVLPLQEVWWCGLLLVGIAAAIHGLAAEKFTFRRRGWLPDQKSEDFKPEWYHRFIAVVVGSIIAASALRSLMKVWRR